MLCCAAQQQPASHDLPICGAASILRSPHEAGGICAGSHRASAAAAGQRPAAARLSDCTCSTRAAAIKRHGVVCKRSRACAAAPGQAHLLAMLAWPFKPSYRLQHAALIRCDAPLFIGVLLASGGATLVAASRTPVTTLNSKSQPCTGYIHSWQKYHISFCASAVQTLRKATDDHGAEFIAERTERNERVSFLSLYTALCGCMRCAEGQA